MIDYNKVNIDHLLRAYEMQLQLVKGKSKVMNCELHRKILRLTHFIETKVN